MKTMEDYLPPSKEEKVLIQTKIEKSLKLRAHHALKSKKITWTDFIIASIHVLLNDPVRPKKSK